MQPVNLRTINIYNLITLIHIIDELDEFQKKLDEFISVNYNRIYKLYKISRGDSLLGSSEVKKFYQENKNIINKINRYYNISMFINDNYDVINNKYKDDLFFIKKYLLDNKDKLNQILILLEKLKKLGFCEFEFDETLDFTKEEHKIDTMCWRNVDGISYFDNMEIIPNYESNIVKYKTTDSVYKIVVNVSILSVVHTKIVLNSLLFDPERLPEKITKESIFDEIISMKNEHQTECETVINDVDLKISIDDLNSQIEEINNIVNKIDDSKSKTEFKQVVSNFKTELLNLKILEEEYESRMIAENPSITQESLEKEKQLYLERKNAVKYEI